MKNCPHCDPKKPKPDPFRESRCTLRQPLMMVIPEGGVHLDCPIHPDGHHVFGPGITWCEYKEGPSAFAGPIVPTRDKIKISC